MKGRYIKCEHCGNPVAEDMMEVHECHEKQNGLIHQKGAEAATPQREGDYFVHPETQEHWNIDRLIEFKQAHQVTCDHLNKKLAEATDQIAGQYTNLQILQEEAVQLKAQYTKACGEIQATREAWKEQLRDKELAQKAISELKSILFNKELTIAQNSGYIQRVRELDPKHEERLVEVPANMVNLGNNPNQLMSADSYHGQNTWGQRWWQIGTEEKK